MAANSQQFGVHVDSSIGVNKVIDRIKELMSYPKCKSVKVINNQQDRDRTTER